MLVLVPTMGADDEANLVAALSGHTAVPVATSSWSTQAFSERSRAGSWLEVISQL